MEVKELEGIYTYDEALELEVDGWRLPTVFELMVITRDKGGAKPYWSCSPCAHSSMYAWYVVFGYGGASIGNKTYLHWSVYLVRSNQAFEHLTKVSREDMVEFWADGILPDWHPEIGGFVYVDESKVNVISASKELVDGERGDSYGSPSVTHGRTAAFWSVILGTEVTAEQVPLCMIALKMAREMNKHKPDNLIDVCGYAQNKQEIEDDKIGD